MHMTVAHAHCTSIHTMYCICTLSELCMCMCVSNSCIVACHTHRTDLIVCVIDLIERPNSKDTNLKLYCYQKKMPYVHGAALLCTNITVVCAKVTLCTVGSFLLHEACCQQLWIMCFGVCQLSWWLYLCTEYVACIVQCHCLCAPSQVCSAKEMNLALLEALDTEESLPVALKLLHPLKNVMFVCALHTCTECLLGMCDYQNLWYHDCCWLLLMMNHN